MKISTIRDWLPPGKTCGVCLSVDDVHPATSADPYEAGGDMEKGAFRHLEYLLGQVPELIITLFIAADWREISSRPTRKWLAAIPVLRDQFYLVSSHPKGTFRLDRHPAFVAYLNRNPRFEKACHGLSHLHRGLNVTTEFQNESVEVTGKTIQEMLEIFTNSGMEYVRGIAPPTWNLPAALATVLMNSDFRFVASSRDIISDIHPDAVCKMSGLQGTSLIYPSLIDGRLVHLATNFQATSTLERARAILRHGGLLCIKGHIVKTALGFSMKDGIDELYINYLVTLLSLLKMEFGEKIWWTSMNQVAERNSV
jgi:hypothetical protein